MIFNSKIYHTSEIKIINDLNIFALINSLQIL